MEFYVPFFKYPHVKEFDDVISWRVIDPDESIRTGDILLFSNSSFMSSAVKFVTRSRWNHIGMACWCEIKHLDGHTYVDIFSFELGSLPFRDLMSGQMADKKVRLVRLADISEMYDMIAVRKLNSYRITTNHKISWCDRFMDFMWKWKKTPFYNTKTFLKIHFITAGGPENETTCSTIAARMLDYMDIFKHNFDPSQINPDDYAAHSKAFPDKIFQGPEQIVYKDHRWVNARLIFITLVLIVIIVLIILIIRRLIRARKMKKITSANPNLHPS